MAALRSPTSLRGERRDPQDWEPSRSLCAYFLLPDGSHFFQTSMGGLPQTYKQPVTHPAIAALDSLHPAVTHLEFVKTALYVTAAAPLRPPVDRLYLFTRALRLQGPMSDANSWVELPWTDDAGVS